VLVGGPDENRAAGHLVRAGGDAEGTERGRPAARLDRVEERVAGAVVLEVEGVDLHARAGGAVGDVVGRALGPDRERQCEARPGGQVALKVAGDLDRGGERQQQVSLDEGGQVGQVDERLAEDPDGERVGDGDRSGHRVDARAMRHRRALGQHRRAAERREQQGQHDEQGQPSTDGSAKVGHRGTGLPGPRHGSGRRAPAVPGRLP